MFSTQQFDEFRNRFDAINTARLFEFVDDYNEFKKRCTCFTDQHVSDILVRFCTDLSNLKSGYLELRHSLEEDNRCEAFDFNVFSILDRGHYEVTTHSAFLAEILNPRGTHGQGTLFLNLFLSELSGLSELEINDGDWFVIRECENVDIRIENYNSSKAIFIENKIYSDAHSGQLSRYYEIWKKRFSKGGAFIYLTPDKKEPADAGFDEKSIYSKEFIKREMKLYSYKGEIAQLLQAASTKIRSSKVRETVKQYSNLINTL
jgi:hypothetical protein